jgi:hypothetical protein
VLGDDLAIYGRGSEVHVDAMLADSERVRGGYVDGEIASDPLGALPDGRVAVAARVTGAVIVAFVDVAHGQVVRRLRVPRCGG